MNGPNLRSEDGILEGIQDGIQEGIRERSRLHPECWFMESEDCVVFAPYRGLRLLPSSKGPVLALWTAEQFGTVPEGIEFAPFPKEPAAKSIEGAAQVLAFVKTRALTPSDALVVIAEISRLSGYDYQVPPNLKSLLFAIGFPPDVIVAPEDYSDLFRVHLQLELGVSQPTAQFLIRVLGLRAAVDEIREVPESKTSSSETSPEANETVTNDAAEASSEATQLDQKAQEDPRTAEPSQLPEPEPEPDEEPMTEDPNWIPFEGPINAPVAGQEGTLLVEVEGL